MNPRSLPRAAQAAACVEDPRPWRRRGRRTISVTIIVVTIVRIVHGDVTWQDPLESALVAAIGLLALDTIAAAVCTAGHMLRRMVPERVVLERRNGRRRLAFGW
ncbi:hypothetical protein ACIP4Y_37285 [Streptomyces sp. NPDC088810]|uniref:hypothetical protein n=1 Tax=Streptomyces sp. NPDC088810 TaxID=3365904 RepID=UPI0037F27B6F